MPEFSRTETLKLKADLADIVTGSVVYTVSTMFGRNIDVSRADRYSTGADTVTVSVILFQDHSHAAFRFVFDQTMLRTLLADFYPPELMKDRKTVEDGACEIANIVCNRVKSYLNQQGFNLIMHLPSVERNAGRKAETSGIVNLNFTLNHDILHVDFAMTGS